MNYIDVVASVGVFVISVVVAKIVNRILKVHVKKLVSKTKTKIDDILLNIVRVPIYIFLLTLGLYGSLRIFPLFKEYVSIINKVFFVLAILIIAYSFTKIVKEVVIYWLKVQKKYEKTPKLISKVINAVIYFIAVLVILEYFGIKITPLVATLGLGGLAIGLALQDTLANFFAGVHIISDRPINVGDFVQVDNMSGYVEDIGWRSTRIRTLPNTIVVIPNSKLAESIIINNSLPQKETSVIVQCGVSYDSDLEKVEKITVDVARKIQKTVPGAVKDFEPFIRYHTFGDSNINFSVILRVERFVDKYLVIHEFIKELKKRYDKEGIEISWPVRKVYMEKLKK